MSKRHGATAIGEYREQGFLPEALTNFMVLLGWSLDGSTEVIPPQTIIDNFTLDRITKSAAIFDQDKLMWMNGVYIRELAFRDLAERMVPFLERDLPGISTPVDREYLQRIAPLVQERLKRLDDSAGLTAIFFGPCGDYETDSAGAKGNGPSRQPGPRCIGRLNCHLFSSTEFDRERAIGRVAGRRWKGVVPCPAGSSLARCASPPPAAPCRLLCSRQWKFWARTRSSSRLRSAVERLNSCRLIRISNRLLISCSYVR